MSIGSCSAATCFELESCKGDPPNCYCDGLCHMFKDCCPDVGNKTSTEESNKNRQCISLIVIISTFISFALNPGPTEIKFMVQPQNLSVNQLEALEIQCSVDSTLIPSFTWNFTKWGSSMPVQIVKENVLLSSDYSFRTVARSTTLIIESAQWVHSGLYTCIASDGIDIIQAEGSLDVFSEL